MKIGLTYDLREDYGIDKKSEVFADFCNPDEIGYLSEAIKANGYEVEMIGNMHQLYEKLLSGEFNCDLVFVEDEGISSRNREAIVPAILELNQTPYVGSDAFVMALTQNKFQTKLIASYLGIRVPKDIYLPYGTEITADGIALAMEKSAIEFPVIVKPNAEGYSMGVFLAQDMEELLEAVSFNFDHYKEEVLVEQFIKGQELSVPMVGNGSGARALAVEVCKYADGSHIDVFSLQDKCFKPLIDEIADIPKETAKCLTDWSLMIYRHLGCADFGRADFKLDEYGVPWFLEINPRPGLTERGPYETCALSEGKTYVEIIGEIIDCAKARYHLGK